MRSIPFLTVKLIVETVDKNPQSAYIVGKFPRAVGYVVMASVPHPPRVALILGRDCVVEFLAMAYVDFLV